VVKTKARRPGKKVNLNGNALRDLRKKALMIRGLKGLLEDPTDKKDKWEGAKTVKSQEHGAPTFRLLEKMLGKKRLRRKQPCC